MRRNSTKTAQGKKQARTTKKAAKKTAKKKVPPKKKGRPPKGRKPDPKATDDQVTLINVPERSDKEYNAEAIRSAFVVLLNKLGRKPTSAELADASGLSVGTVKRHVRNIRFEPERSPFRLLTPEVIKAVYDGAKNGSSRDKKLWLQLFEGLTEKTDVTSGGRALDAAKARKIEKDMTEEQARAIFEANLNGKNDIDEDDEDDD